PCRAASLREESTRSLHAALPISAHALVSEFPLPPSAVVDSGGGLQAWWLFAEPLAADDDAQALLDRWGATWLQLADRSGWHLDRSEEHTSELQSRENHVCGLLLE